MTWPVAQFGLQSFADSLPLALEVPCPQSFHRRRIGRPRRRPWRGGAASACRRSACRAKPRAT